MKIARGLRSSLFVAALALAGCGEDEEKTLSETATLTTAEEVPTPTVTGTPTGTFKYTLVESTRMMTFTLSVSGLSGAATGAHLHRGELGQTGPVAKPLLEATQTLNNNTPLIGTVTLEPDDLARLKDGKIYVNVHTAANMDGEIRGQLDGK